MPREPLDLDQRAAGIRDTNDQKLINTDQLRGVGSLAAAIRETVDEKGT